MHISFHHIEASSRVDGPGERTVLFMQGCPLHCSGCQNQALWDVNTGMIMPVSEVVRSLSMLASKHGNITISGGEPFYQPKALSELVRGLRNCHEIKNIIVYSGYRWETLTSGVNPYYMWVMDILENINILVDGPYMEGRDHDLTNWRGSSNQRPIDVQESLQQPSIPVLLDWEKPVISVGVEGDLVLPVGIAGVFVGIGNVQPNRMCGQV